MRISYFLFATPALVCMSAAAFASGPLSEARASIDAGDPGAAMLVIDTGAVSVNAQDEAGYTLLHYAAAKGSSEASKLLIARGADITIRALNGKLAADLAADPELKALLTPAAGPPPSVP